MGYGDSSAVSILDTATLKAQFKGDAKGIRSGSFSSVTWTSSNQIVAGGNAEKYVWGPEGFHSLGYLKFFRFIDASGKKILEDTSVYDDPYSDINSVKSCGSTTIFSLSDHTLGKIDPSGEAHVLEAVMNC